MVRIALDCMGGDRGPTPIVAGAIDAIEANHELTVLFIGDEGIIRAALKNEIKRKYNSKQIEIHHAAEKVLMDDAPALALRQKRQSSLHIANQLVKSGEAEGVFTAGNTGAAMAISLMVLGRIPGIIRPALLINIPSLSKIGWTSFIDVGANVDSKPKMLAQFAVMGDLYAKNVLNIAKPRVGLLSLGEEASKGNELVRETHELFKHFKTINFIGNIEGQDVINGKTDVVVCDGFVGNVLMKFGEGIMLLVQDILKREVMASGWLTKLAVAMVVPTIKKVYRKMDYREYGCAPLLGVNGISTIGHGKSTSKAIKNALLHTARYVEQHINDQIEKSLIENGVAE